jgi:tetratricopeptide (TPR) repeat protein
LEVKKNAWRLAVPVAGDQPEVELSASAIRLALPSSGSDAVDIAVPLEAQPIDLENAKCSFSRKRSELLIEWPQSTVGIVTPSEAETRASERNDMGSSAVGATSEETLANVATDDDTTFASVDSGDAVVESTLVTASAVDIQDTTTNFSDNGMGTVEEPAQEATSAEEWRSLGNAAVKSGDLEEGIRCYSAGIAAGGGDEAMLCSNRALCFCQLGRHEEGLTDAQRCVLLRPDFFKGYVRGAKALRALGRPEEALAFLKRCPKNEEAAALAVELKPEAEAAESARIAKLGGAEKAKEEGNVLFRKGLFEEAASKYSQALEACSDQEADIALAIRNNRAACYHQLSNFTSVVADASYVLAREPANLKALTRRMLALEPLERYEAALEDARAVLRQDPRNEMANKVQHRLGKLVRDFKRSGNA